jgi:GNAT superfamily N-acetyltransferase
MEIMSIKNKSRKNVKIRSLSFHPLTSERWKDFETLFGERGACGGCWCMYWRLKRSEYNNLKGEGNKKAIKKIIMTDDVPGILAYDNHEPIGWCAVSPRPKYSALERSRVLQPVDDKPVWSVVCFFVAKPYRKKGVTIKLLDAAVKHAKKNGAKIVEGYPVEPKKGEIPDVFAYTGLSEAFLKAGFKEVLRRSETRPIMRYYL